MQATLSPAVHLKMPTAVHLLHLGPRHPRWDFLQYPVKVRARGKIAYLNTYALLGSGSTKTLCSKALMEQFSLKGGGAKFSLTIVNNSEENVGNVVTLEVIGVKGAAEGNGVIHPPKVAWHCLTL